MAREGLCIFLIHNKRMSAEVHSIVIGKFSFRAPRRRSPAPFAKPHLRCSPLLRSSLLLIARRSLRIFMQTDFHASMKSVHKKIRVNWNNKIDKNL